MKNRLLLSFLLSLSVFLLNAQSLDLTVFSGYTFADKLPIEGGRAKIYGGHSFGTALTYYLNSHYSVELFYNRIESRVTVSSDLLGSDIDERISTNYILAGSNRILPLNDRASILGGLKIGAVVFAPYKNDANNNTYFAAGINGGFQYLFTDKVGIKLQANAMFPITDVGASLWWSAGSGPEVGVSSGSSLIQIGLNGGLVFRMLP